MWFRRKTDPILDALQAILKQNAESQKAVMDVAKQMAIASAKQSEVLASYLDLFKSPEPPRRWERDIEQENKNYLAERGFPVEASVKEQAKWLAEHADD